MPADTSSEEVVAENLLSADSLGFDDAGNLDVGGGDVFGTTGHYGYANVVSCVAVQRALAGGAPADPSNPSEVATLAPDPCKNDDWTPITYLPGVDTVLGPLFRLLSLPLIVLTFGLFLLVVNAALLAITAWLSDRFDISGFWSAVLGGLLIAILNWGIDELLPKPRRSAAFEGRELPPS